MPDRPVAAARREFDLDLERVLETPTAAPAIRGAHAESGALDVGAGFEDARTAMAGAVVATVTGGE